MAIVIEVQVVGALGQVHDVLAAQDVVGHYTVHRLFHAQAVGVVLKGRGRAILAHLPELAAFSPITSITRCY